MGGGYHCGDVRFKVTGKPYWVGACYCVDCRKISGSPFTIFAGFNKKNFKILKGIPKIYSSSKNVRRSFCENCSSPITYTYVNSPDNDKVFIPIGVFDNPSNFKLEEHIWTSQKLPWIKINDNLPQSN
ncbi:MAG: GFA family protein [Nanoarchaeota archaeon]